MVKRTEVWKGPCNDGKALRQHRCFEVTSGVVSKGMAALLRFRFIKLHDLLIKILRPC